MISMRLFHNTRYLTALAIVAGILASPPVIAAPIFGNADIPDMLHYFTTDRGLFSRYYGHRNFKGTGRLLNIFGVSILDIYSANISSSQGEINCTPAVGPEMTRLREMNDDYTPNQPVIVQGNINGIAFGTLMLNPCRVSELPDIATLMPMAEHGNPEAQYQLGEIYSFGIGVLANAKVGLDWYQKAAKQGHAKATVAIKQLSEHNDLEAYKAEQDRLAALADQEQERIAAYSTASLDQLYQAAKDGDAEAQMNIGRRYLAGEGVTRDERLGVEYLSRATAQGNVRALHALQAAATPGLLSKGSAEAAFALGHLYQSAKENPANTAMALAWFRIAAQANYPGAADLVKIYDAKHLDNLRKAADAGDPMASLSLAKQYLESKNDNKESHKDKANLAQAIPLLIRAAGLGSPEALTLLKAQARPGWFADNNADAAFAVGELYYKGIGVAEDAKEAARWYKIAAKLGVKEAKARLDAIELVLSTDAQKSKP
jgi:TPR repeat protein